MWKIGDILPCFFNWTDESLWIFSDVWHPSSCLSQSEDSPEAFEIFVCVWLSRITLWSVQSIAKERVEVNKKILSSHTLDKNLKIRKCVAKLGIQRNCIYYWLFATIIFSLIRPKYEQILRQIFRLFCYLYARDYFSHNTWGDFS